MMINNKNNLHLLAFFITSKLFLDLNKNMQQLSCIKVPNLMVLCNIHLAYNGLGQKLTLTFQICPLVVLLKKYLF